LQQAYGEDINSQNSGFIIDFLKSRVPLKKKVCKSLCQFLSTVSIMGDTRNFISHFLGDNEFI